MKRNILVVLAMLVALTLVGCFNYQENMVLNKDGSGTIDMRMAIDKSMMEGMKAMSQMMDSSSQQPQEESFISKANIEKFLSTHDTGVKLLSYEESEEEGMQVWKLKYSFKDLNSVQYITESLNEDFESDEGAGEDSTMMQEKPELTFKKQDDGTWLFERGMDTENQMPGMGAGPGMGEDESWGDEKDSSQGEAEEENEHDSTAMSDTAKGMDEMAEQMGQLGAAMKKMGIKLTVQFPGKVIKSNATTVDGNTATWEYKGMAMNKFPKKLTAVIE